MSRLKIAHSSAVCRYSGTIERRHNSSPRLHLDQIASKAFICTMSICTL
jgi:hypothetical protein